MIRVLLSLLLFVVLVPLWIVPTAGSVAVLTAGAGGTAAGTGEEAGAAATSGGLVVASTVADSLEIRDPLFQLIIGILESDSLGVWTQDDVRAYLESTGRPSALPVTYIQSIERHPVAETQAESRRGARVVNRWRLVLTEPLDLAMPYSILGYHPGSLIVSQEVEFSEWYLGSPNLHVASDGEVAIHATQGLKTLRLDSGWIILDVDGWLDKRLGGKVDDAWTEGFCVGRVEGELYGISLGVNPKGKPLYGDFDFRNDRIFSERRPISRSLHLYTRPWVKPPEGTPSYAWQYEK